MGKCRRRSAPETENPRANNPVIKDYHLDQRKPECNRASLIATGFSFDYIDLSTALFLGNRS
jgi:hypothetical protein